MNTGPWYEQATPSLDYVVKHETNKRIFNDNWIKQNERKLQGIAISFDVSCRETCDHINRIIRKSINETITDTMLPSLGSYRGYATFGLPQYLQIDVQKQILKNVDQFFNEV